MEVFRDYAYYYNAFYKDKDYRAEAGQIDLLLKRYGKGVKCILDLGCGTGKHDVELADMGYQCMGIDRSQEMIDIAGKDVQGRKDIHFSVADIRRFRTDVQYDAVISLFHVMSYQNTNEDILDAFQTARHSLTDGGIFLFDVWYGPGVLSDKPVLRVKEIQDDKYRLIRIARPVMHDKTNVVDVGYEVFVMDRRSGETKTINELHSMRYFFRPELALYLKEAGFELVDNLDCMSLGETGYDSWTSYFVARAI